MEVECLISVNSPKIQLCVICEFPAYHIILVLSAAKGGLIHRASQFMGGAGRGAGGGGAGGQ